MLLVFSSDRIIHHDERRNRHDCCTRFLSAQEFTSKNLWKDVKLMIRQVEYEDVYLIFDDTIQEKQWTGENEIMCWYYDQCEGRTIKRINLWNALYYSGHVSISIVLKVIRKPFSF